MLQNTQYSISDASMEQIKRLSRVDNIDVVVLMTVVKREKHISDVLQHV